ncbi:MAG: FMN-binding protein [Spirochaetales bacterium]|nr:FMN-binding protein [Spirochaetales bacterium]
MKKTILLFSILLIAAGSIFADDYRDGVYFAQEKEFPGSGWKYNVTLVVNRGQIKEVSWNGSNINGGDDKVTMSRTGRYGMEEKGGAMAPWWKQAQAVEKALIRFQDVDRITLSDSAGHTDAVSGASIKVGPFVALVKEALAAGPVGYGPYKDGSYSAQQLGFHNGYKYAVAVTVTSGYIVSVKWDGIAQDGGKSKAQRSVDGEYGMVANGGAMAPWFEQAKAVEAEVISTQSIDQPDAVSGATIGIEPFYELLNSALRGKRR